MIRHWILFGLCWLVLVFAGVANGQAPATYGFSGDGCGNWRPLEPIAVGNEYLPNQCGPNGCGVPFFRGGGQIQYQPYQGGGGIQMRPRGEPFRFPAMCEVEGGMGCHIGNQLVLTCTHGAKGTVTYQGQRYSAQVIVESPTQGGCDATILKCDAPFTQAIDLLPATPPTGTEVAWQGGTARIIRVDATSMWVAGRFRLGDSGGPIWTREGIVGVVSAVRTDGANESIGANAEACTRLLVQARLRLGISSSSGPAAINPGGTVPPPAQGAGSQCPPCAGLSAVEKRVETLEQFRDRMIAESKGKTLVAVEWQQQVDSRLTHIEQQVEDTASKGRVSAIEDGMNKINGALAGVGDRLKAVEDRPQYKPDYDQLAGEVLKRLPPVKLEQVDMEGAVIQEAAAPLGKPLKLRLKPIKPGATADAR